MNIPGRPTAAQQHQRGIGWILRQRNKKKIKERLNNKTIIYDKYESNSTEEYRNISEEISGDKGLIELPSKPIPSWIWKLSFFFAFFWFSIWIICWEFIAGWNSFWNYWSFFISCHIQVDWSNFRNISGISYLCYTCTNFLYSYYVYC
jgi:hypothetical protein